MTLGLNQLPAPASGGEIDYRLARDAAVREFKKGRLSGADVCDAHPELKRAAKNLGQSTEIDCPICEKSKVVLLSYVFGPRMPPHGRCVSSAAEMASLGSGSSQLTCYVVEVCPECSWNHLSRQRTLGGR